VVGKRVATGLTRILFISSRCVMVTKHAWSYDGSEE